MPAVDIGSGCTVWKSEPSDKTMSNKRVCVCGVTYNVGPLPGGGYQPIACNCKQIPPPSGKITHYATYPVDVVHRDENGNFIRDVNGNFMYMHRKGDRILDDDGKPVIIPSNHEYIYHGKRKDRPYGMPNIEFRGINTGDSRCGRTHFDDLEYMGNEEFDVIFRAVAEEKMRRVTGGQPQGQPHDEHTAIARL